MPAAAVIRGGQALPGFIGRKVFRRRSCKLFFKAQGLTLEGGIRLQELKSTGAAGIVGVGVKSVDIDKNSEGVGGLLSTS